MRGSRPNVVLIVLDDMGFADLGCFGSDIETPAFDGLAAGGLSYNRFHVTPLCSPTRACMLTGRNHHRVEMGDIAGESTLSPPGYTARIPRSAGMLPRLLRDAGYSTFAVGKWHLTPRDDIGAGGPFDRWPLAVGFDQFYGFLRGMTDQYAPELVRDNAFVDPPATAEEGYHLTEDLASQAIGYVQAQHQAAQEKPFFLYFTPGAVHFPHQVPGEWVERYRGRFDHGWDVERERRFERQLERGLVPSGTVNTSRPAWVAAWESLSDDERRIFARQMEVYAGFLSHTDAQVGRLLDSLATLDVLDDTVVMVVSDNGTQAGYPAGRFDFHAGAEANSLTAMLARLDDFGGSDSSCVYAEGWAWAGNTPLRLWKGYTWLGGVRVPLIAHWPSGISAAGQVRSQFCHAVDLMPTVLDLACVEPPTTLDGVAQLSFDGRSLRPTFDDPDAHAPRDTQYFEMRGSRAIFHDGWKAVTDHNLPPDEPERDFGSDRWSLFRLDADFSEAHDLAGAEPEVLSRLIDLWSHEADRNGVTLLGHGAIMRNAQEAQPARRDRYTGFADSAPITTPAPTAGFAFEAELEIDDEADGVVCAHYLRLSDCYAPRAMWACYLLQGRPVVSLDVGAGAQRAALPESLPAGRYRLQVRYRPAVVGEGSLVVGIDDRESVSVAVPPAGDSQWELIKKGALLIGRDRRAAAHGDYLPPFAFTGHIHMTVYEPRVGSTESSP